MTDERRTEDRVDTPNVDPFAQKPQKEATADHDAGSRPTRANAEGTTDRGPSVATAPREDRISPDRGPTSGSGTETPTGTAAIAQAGQSDDPKALLDESEAENLRGRWEECQQRFVDEPRASVESADQLVAEVMQKVATQFVATREALERQWDRGDRVSTEDLRQAMRMYRDFFNRLLAA